MAALEFVRIADDLLVVRPNSLAPTNPEFQTG